jgi:hypothetical protein
LTRGRGGQPHSVAAPLPKQREGGHHRASRGGEKGVSTMEERRGSTCSGDDGGERRWSADGRARKQWGEEEERRRPCWPMVFAAARMGGA